MGDDGDFGGGGAEDFAIGLDAEGVAMGAAGQGGVADDGFGGDEGDAPVRGVGVEILIGGESGERLQGVAEEVGALGVVQQHEAQVWRE